MTVPVEEPLRGGNTSQVHRVGDTVRREARPWTPAVHDLLEFLTAAGLPNIPRPHGRDGEGREILDYIPGSTATGEPWDAAFWSDRLLTDVGIWLRRFHQVVADYRPPETARWFTGRGAPAFGQIICHNDVAPYNVVLNPRGRLVGVIDWDTAAPALPEWDLAGAAWQWVPLHHPDITAAIGGPGEAQQVRRLRLLCNAYGYLKPAELLSRIQRRVQTMVTALEDRDAADHPLLSRLRSGGHARMHAKTAGYLEDRLPVLAKALRHG